MLITTGYFDSPETHHKGRFRIFRFTKTLEIWMGHRYWVVSK